MDILDLQEQIRGLIEQNNLKGAIEALKNSQYFTDSEDQNFLTTISFKHTSFLNSSALTDPSRREADAHSIEIINSIFHLLDQEIDNQKYKHQTFFNPQIGSEKKEEKIRVFFSLGSPYNDQQQEFVNRLVAFFDRQGVELWTLKEWNDDDPIEPIIRGIKSSYGCLVLALERYFIHNGSEKRGSKQESPLMEKGLTSPWLHIEAAVARTLELPIIIVKDASLHNEGLIHNDKQRSKVVLLKKSLPEETNLIEENRVFLFWIDLVKDYYKQHQGK